MSKILYGLCGVGIGHAVRGKVIIEYLNKKHDVMIICSHEPYEYLKKSFKNIYKIEGFELEFKNNSIINFLTLIKNFKKINKKNYYNLKNILKNIKEFNPDYVISDWESISSYASKKLKKPLISIDNQHFLVKGNFDILKGYFFDYLKARLILKLLIRKADYYIINSFYETKLKKEEENVFLIPPVLREEIINAKPMKKNYFLVYQSTKTYEKLINILKNIDLDFIIYGYGKEEKISNLTFKKFNEKEFIKDLIDCEGVICNGGFTLISEAIYLEKPILSVPVKKHFEQLINADYVQKKGFGLFYKDLDEAKVKEFILNLHKYNYAKKKQKGNKKLFEVLDKIIKP